MNQSAKVIRIFIASPGDLDGERSAVRSAIDEINRDHSDHWDVQFKPVGFEDIPGGSGRAQSIINERLEKCDYLFGIVHNRLGKPSHPTNDPNAPTETGFIEEYNLACSCQANGILANIYMFFKTVDEAQLADPGPELQKVLDFKETEFHERKTNFYKSFDSAAALEGHIRQTLTDIGYKLWEKAKSEAAEVARKPKQESESGASNELATLDESNSVSVFSDEEKSFLADVKDTVYSDGDEYRLNLARLRLIGASHSQHGNDSLFIGAHDANFLFTHRNGQPFSNSETRHLFRAGLKNLDYQNLPVWHWLYREIGLTVTYQLSMESAFGSDEIQSAALRLLRLLEIDDLQVDDFLTRERYFIFWFGDKDKRSLHIAAFEYLSQAGTAADIMTLDANRDKFSESAWPFIDELRIILEAKKSKKKAIAALMALNPSQLRPETHHALFGEPQGLSTDQLIRVLNLQVADVRLMASRVLFERDAILVDLAKRLLDDPDVRVRYYAVRALESSDAALTEEGVKEKLTEKQSTRGFGLLGSFSGRRRAQSDRSQFDRFKEHQLGKMSRAALVKTAASLEPFNVAEYRSIYTRFPKHYAAEIRANLKDCFSDFFERGLERKYSAHGENPPDQILRLRKQAEELKDFLCKNLTEGALKGLISLRDKSDLELVREVVVSEQSPFAAEVLDYLGRYGDWSDIDRIIVYADGAISRQVTILGRDYDVQSDVTATALYKVGRKRLPDLFEVTTDARMKSVILRQLTKAEIRSWPDDWLLEQFRHENDAYRKTLALRVLECLPKKRLKKLLDTYVEGGEYRYYNVVHWLDFGVSAPMATVHLLVGKELAD